MSHAFEEAAPVSRAQLEELGWRLRCLFGCEDEPWLPVAHIVELGLAKLLGPDFVFDVWDAQEMGDNHGLSYPDEKMLILRDDVYDGLLAHRGRDRMTAIHEVAHLVLHPQRALARRLAAAPPPPYRDPEWQAKCLAGTIMMPARMLNSRATIRDIVDDFGVSRDAAAYRARQLGLVMQ